MPVFGTGYEIVTSTTRPSAPMAGQVVYETDTKQHQVYNGSSWLPLVPTGLVKAFAGRTAPTGWLLCNGTAGTAVTQSAHPGLWALLTTNGTAYPFGGSGSTTYTPDLRGRAVHGLEAMGGGAAVGRITTGGSGVDGMSLGAVGGSKLSQAHAHSGAGSTTTANENTNHAHAWTLGGNGGALGTGDLPHRGYYGWDGNFATWGATGFGYGAGAQRHTHSYSISGSTIGHNLTGGDEDNIAPMIALNYIVKV
jgi:microcystin-dependent protein